MNYSPANIAKATCSSTIRLSPNQLQRYRKVSAETNRRNFIFPNLALPNHIISYAKIQKCEYRDKTGKQRFTGIVYAEPHHIFYKDTER